MSNTDCRNCTAWNKCSFKSLKDHEMYYLNKVKQTITIEKRQILNEQNTEIDYVYCIQSGFAKIIWPDKNFNSESILKLVGPGDFTGYRCLFSESHFRATASALCQVTACKIPKEFFIELINSNKQFNMHILNLMGSEIKKAEERLHSFTAKNVRERLAECLIKLYELSGEDVDNQQQIKIKLTRDEIASLIGTAKETVVRTLTDFKEE
jgi:CRP-like cAMP-binding protein